MAEEKSSITFERVKISLLLIFLLWIQWLLFKQYAMREILWGYPDFSDQSAYLRKAFVLYDLILHEGLLNALRWDFFETNGTGSFLHLHGALSFLLFGPHRFNALSLNFLYYALFQTMFVHVVYFFSRSWKVSFICLGILISSLFPFNNPGGFYDFRIDFISFCLFGIFLLAGLRSNIFVNKKWSIVAGMVGAYLFMFRHNTIVYMTGIYALTGIGIALVSLFQTKQIQNVYRSKRFQGLLLSGSTYVILIFPFLGVNFKAIFSYYLSQAVNRSAIRNSQLGLEGFWNFLLFYPVQLFTKYIGLFAFSLSVFCVFLLCIVSLFYRKKYHDVPKAWDNRNEFDIPYLSVQGFIFICFFVPLLVLTINTAKSPIVGGILYPSLLSGFVVALIYVYCKFCKHYHKYRGLRFLILLLVVFSLLSGILTHMVMSAKLSPQSMDRERVEKTVEMHLELARLAVRMDLKYPSILIDTIRDDLSPRILTTLLYEQDKQLVVALDVGRIDQIFPETENKIIEDLDSTDFMLLREGPRLCHGFEILPYNQLMGKIRPRLRNYAEENMIFIKKWQIGNDEFTLFATPHIRLEKGVNFFGDSFGWITDKGFSIRIPTDLLKRKSIILFTGKIHKEPFVGEFPSPKAKIQCGEKLQETVPSELFVHGNKYDLTLDVSESMIQGCQGNCEIIVEFDAFFVPAELGINSDTRRLVIQTPEKMQLTTFSKIKEIDRSE